jgi:alpha-galactosidase
MVKLAYIGGGSLFVPSILHGIAQALRAADRAYPIEVSLYDVQPNKAQLMAAYGELLRSYWDLPLQVYVAHSRAEALQDADVVFVCVWLQEEHARIDEMHRTLGFELPEEGPQTAVWATACAPWSLAVAAEMRVYCPGALFITVMNPTDVMAGIIGLAGGVRAAGLCVEVDGLRGALAYYFSVPVESIQLRHAGVNHNGWVLGISVDGRDGYELWRERWPEVEGDPDFHPGNNILNPLINLTGHLKSTGYHIWPYQVAQTPEQRIAWTRWPAKRELYEEAVHTALRTGIPIEDPPHIHPERSMLNYPNTGVAFGKLMQSLATHQTNTLALQVMNHGSIVNWPDNVMVEVPTLVHGKLVQPWPVGELPEWLGGYTRLLAIQRRLIIDYVLERRLLLLKQAMAVMPMFGTTQQFIAMAEYIHERWR